MENLIEQFADSFCLYIADNLDTQLPINQIYNNWVKTEPITPSMDVGMQLLNLAVSLRKQDKIKRELLVQLLSN